MTPLYTVQFTVRSFKTLYNWKHWTSKT